MENQSIMRCLIVLTTLLSATRLGQGVPVQLEGTLDRSVPLRSEDVLTDDFECYLTHGNEIYQIHPKRNWTDGIMDYPSRSCSLLLSPLRLEYAGPWSMIISWNVNGETVKNTTEYEIHLTYNVRTAFETLDDSTSKFFTRLITENGTYVTVFPQEESNVVYKCLLVQPKNNGNADVYDLFNSTQIYPRMELYGHCGVRMLVDSSKTGFWYITQQVASYLYQRFDFEIEISYPTYYEKSQENLLWLLGSPETIQMKDLSSKSIFCNITRPDGKTILLDDSSCTYHIPKVSRDHEGLWIVQYSIPERINLMEKRFIVEIHDPDFIHVSVSNDLTLQFMCKTTIKNSDFCIFTRPDGVMINLPQGIGNDRYEYFGNGYKQYSADQETNAECGLRIRKQMSEDIGLWKCSLGQRGKIISAYIWAYGEKSFDPNAVIPSENVYVKRGDNFTIKCQTLAPLEYCWLLSPNGTIHSVSRNKNSDNTLIYEGEGLSLGTCGAKIENASDAHVGNWSCRMGAINGIERQVPVQVAVTESYMYVNQSVINITSSNTHIKLVCNVLPQKEATIRYCRWVRPDGLGIHKNKSGQYLTSEGVRACSLEIREYNELNIGNWFCYARLSDDLDTEVFATIEIAQKDKLITILGSVSITTLSIVIICIVTIIPIMLFIVGMTFYRKKFCHRRRINNIDYTINEIDVQITQEKPKN